MNEIEETLKLIEDIEINKEDIKRIPKYLRNKKHSLTFNDDEIIKILKACDILIWESWSKKDIQNFILKLCNCVLNANITFKDISIVNTKYLESLNIKQN